LLFVPLAFIVSASHAAGAKGVGGPRTRPRVPHRRRTCTQCRYVVERNKPQVL